MKAVFLDLDTLGKNISLQKLQQVQSAWDFYPATPPGQLMQRVGGATILVCNKVVISRQLMQDVGSLKLICVAATGTNNIDLVAARDLGISVSNVTGYATGAVTQHVFTLLFALTTNLLNYHHLVRANAWQQADSFCLLDFPIAELAGKTLGIVGYGELGQGVARVASAFGMKLLIAQGRDSNKKADRLPLHELLPQVDALSLHCPLTRRTRNLIGARELEMMKPSALLINTARGGIVDEVALAHALQQGVIGGAGIDVLTTEPPTLGNPLLNPDIPNIIVTPHIAWASQQARQQLIDDVALTIAEFHRGNVRNQVVDG